MRVLENIISRDDFISKLFPNPWEALATFIAFVILLIAVFFFAYKPVKELLKKRQDYVDNKIKDAEIREEKSKELLEEANLAKENSKKEGMEILEQYKADALATKQEIINEGKEEAKKQLQDAKKEIAQEIIKSKQDIHNEIVDVALSASKEVLKRNVNEDDEKRLLDDFINDLDK